MGPKPHTRKRPHLLGHEQENEQLEGEVATAMAEVRQFTHDDIPRTAQREQAYQQAKRRSREAAKRRKLTRQIQRWKWEWVDSSLTDELRTAQIKGDTRRVFAIHKKLGIRDDRVKLQMTTKTVLNPEAERGSLERTFSHHTRR